MAIRQLSILAPALALLPGGLFSHSLIDKNPFIWPGFVAPEEARPAPPPAQAADDLEFHAIYELDGVTRALIRDRRSQRFQWLIMGEAGEDGLLGKSFDPEKNELLVVHAGGEKTLSLRPVPEPSGPAFVAAPTPVPAPVRPATPTSPPTVRRTLTTPSPTVSTGAGGSRAVNPPVVARPGSAASSLGSPGFSRHQSRGTPAVQQPTFRPPDPGMQRPATEPPKDIPVLDPRARVAPRR